MRIWDSYPGIPPGILQFLPGYANVSGNDRELWLIGVLATFIMKMARNQIVQLDNALMDSFGLQRNELVSQTVLTIS